MSWYRWLSIRNFFWLKLTFFVLRSLNYGFQSEQMLLSLRQCLLFCLPKGEKPRQVLKNWRPVSLLSVVYKIASSALARRLSAILHKIISNTQLGFKAGHFIGENTRVVYDLIQLTKEKNY